MSEIQLYVLDAYALMAFFRRETGHEIVRGVLKERNSGLAHVMISDINWGEFYYMMAKKASFEEAVRRLRYIERFGIVTIPVDRELVKVAAEFKINFSTSKSPLSYADCIAAALAQKQKAVLLTGDPEFKHLESLISIRWLR